MKYWLIKSEPDVYSIDDLKRDRTSVWEGVRNYQARNFLREMQMDDLAFFYHSNTSPPGIVGLARVVKAGVVDPTQFEPQSGYYDPKSLPEKPRWITAEMEFVEKFTQILTLAELRERFSPDDFWVVRTGNRLSVMPVPSAIAEQLLKLANAFFKALV